MKTTDLIRKLLPSLYERAEYKDFFTTVLNLLSGEGTQPSGWTADMVEFFVLIVNLLSDDEATRRTAVYELSTYMSKNCTLSDRPLQQLYHFNRESYMHGDSYEVTSPVSTYGDVLKYDLIEFKPDADNPNIFYVFGTPGIYFLPESDSIEFSDSTSTKYTGRMVSIRNGILSTRAGISGYSEYSDPKRWLKFHIPRHTAKYALSVSTRSSLQHDTYENYLTKIKFTPTFTDAIGDSIPYRTIHHYEKFIPYSTVSFS